MSIIVPKQLRSLVSHRESMVKSLILLMMTSSLLGVSQNSKVARRFRSVRVPYRFAYSACYAWEKYSKWSKGQLPPAFNRRRCAEEWKSQHYLNQKLKTRLGWKPRVPMKRAMETFLAQFGTNSKD